MFRKKSNTILTLLPPSEPYISSLFNTLSKHWISIAKFGLSVSRLTTLRNVALPIDPSDVIMIQTRTQNISHGNWHQRVINWSLLFQKHILVAQIPAQNGTQTMVGNGSYRPPQNNILPHSVERISTLNLSDWYLEWVGSRAVEGKTFQQVRLGHGLPYCYILRFIADNPSLRKKQRPWASDSKDRSTLNNKVQWKACYVIINSIREDFTHYWDKSSFLIGWH